MKQLFAKIIVAILFALQLQVSYASCDSTITCNNGCCCKINMAPSSIMMSHLHQKNKWMFSYSYMNMAMKGLVNGNKTISENEVYNNYLMLSTKMNMQMHMLMAMYGVSNKLTLMAMFNYRINTMNMQMPHTSNSIMQNMHHSNIANETMMSSGFADIQLFAMYCLFKNETHQLIVFSGLNVPTGNINKKGKADDMAYPSSQLSYAMQLGTGTWDVLPGLSYTIQQNKFASGIQWNNSLRFFNNSNNYRVGNETALHLWGAYSWLNTISSSIHIETNYVGEIKGKDAALYEFNEPSANVENYGGRFLRAYIGSSYTSKNKSLSHFRISAEYGFQLIQQYNGIQIPLKNILNTSINYSF
ncbi:MAG: hypothetical protein RL708_1357 [Bacteroidota bacterium]|jgi:hypothetical protein